MGQGLLFENLEWILVAASAFSATMSLYVVLTSLVFGDMGKRPFMRIIFWISFCDLIGSVCAGFGFPPSSSPLCPIQAFALIAFFKASWIWIVVLCYQMHYFLKHGRFGLMPWQMHLITWSLSMGSTLLPLAEIHYGRDDDPSGWCFLTDGTSGSKVTFYWSLATLNIFLILCLAAMITYSVLLYFRFRNLSSAVRENVVHIVQGFFLYPLGMVATWLPGCIVSALANADVLDQRVNTVLAFGVLAVINTQNGTITALIFMMLSNESWQRWRRLLRRWCCGQVTHHNDIDDESWQEIIRRYENETDVSQDVFSDTASVYTVDASNGVFAQDSNLTAVHHSNGKYPSRSHSSSHNNNNNNSKRFEWGVGYCSTEMTISKASQSNEAARLRGELGFASMSPSASLASSAPSTAHSINSLFSLNHKTYRPSPTVSTSISASSSSVSVATSPFFSQKPTHSSVGTPTSSHTIPMPAHWTASPTSVRPAKRRSNGDLQTTATGTLTSISTMSTTETESTDSSNLNNREGNSNNRSDNDIPHQDRGVEDVVELADCTREYFETSQLSSPFVHESTERAGAGLTTDTDRLHGTSTDTCSPNASQTAVRMTASSSSSAMFPLPSICESHSDQ